MSARNIFDMIMNVSNITRELRDAGIRVEVGDDFSRYRSYRDKRQDRGGLFPIFNTATTFIDESNGFWI